MFPPSTMLLHALFPGRGLASSRISQDSSSLMTKLFKHLTSQGTRARARSSRHTPNVHVETDAFIDSLDDDVLALILTMSAISAAPQSFGIPECRGGLMHLSHVCRRWRYLVCEKGAILWRCINLELVWSLNRGRMPEISDVIEDGILRGHKLAKDWDQDERRRGERRYQRAQRIVNLHIEHSKDFPLVVYFPGAGNGRHAFKEEIYGLLMDTDLWVARKRWSVFQMRIFDGCIEDTCPSLIPLLKSDPNEWQALRFISLRIVTTQNRAEDWVQIIDGLASSVNVKYMTLIIDIVGGLSTWAMTLETGMFKRLTQLSLGGSAFNHPNFEEITAIIRSAPDLTVLHFNCTPVSDPLRENRDHSKIRNANLKVLVINVGLDDEWAISHFYERLDLPRLESAILVPDTLKRNFLALYTADHGPRQIADSITKVVEIIGRNLRFLALRLPTSAAISFDALMAIARYTPNLEQFVVHPFCTVNCPCAGGLCFLNVLNEVMPSELTGDAFFKALSPVDGGEKVSWSKLRFLDWDLRCTEGLTDMAVIDFNRTRAISPETATLECVFDIYQAAPETSLDSDAVGLTMNYVHPTPITPQKTRRKGLTRNTEEIIDCW
ncbi:hypothetical protein FA15DRAFT_656605 [Coprinopsis marcescibilis]|uniref:F-box domain-containing protein n=1 Tax=Coprinopsis marcescibilis TaxID=230819 RepID=A0A5C3KSF4_COPMA|nr:hypothetical protein FA15DRAFT_656605 [Coprinopsis marcescibilis]